MVDNLGRYVWCHLSMALSNMKINRYPQFNYSPYLISDKDLEIKLDLEDLGLEEDDSEMEVFAHKHLNKVFVYNTMVTHFQQMYDDEKMRYWNNKYLEAYPNSINGRINLVNLHDNALGERTDIFKQVFEKEIDILLHEKYADFSVTDDYYHNLIVFLTQSFCEVGEIENAKKIFRYVLGFGNLTSIEELAFTIRGLELNDLMQFNYVAHLMLEKRQVFEWHEIMIQYLRNLNPNPKPHNLVAYAVLNKNTLYISEEDILDFDEYHGGLVEVYEDLIWVLYNGFLRQFAGEDFFKEHFICNTILVAAKFKIRPFLTDFIYLLKTMPQEKDEDLFGFEFENTCAPGLTILASDNLTPIIEAYEELDTFISQLISIIVTVAVFDCKESQRASDYITKTVNELVSKENYELIQIWLLEIVANGLEGYDWLVDMAHREKWFDFLSIKDVYASEKSQEFYATKKQKIEDVTIEDLIYCHQFSYENLNPIDIDLEGVIDNLVIITNDRNLDKEFNEMVEENEFLNKDLNPFLGIDVEEALGLKSEKPESNVPSILSRSPCPCGSGKKYIECCLSNN